MNKGYGVHQVGRLIGASVMGLLMFLVMVILAILNLITAPKSDLWFIIGGLFFVGGLFYLSNMFWTRLMIEEVEDLKKVQGIKFDGNLLSEDSYARTIKKLKLNVWLMGAVFAVLSDWRLDRSFLKAEEKRIHKIRNYDEVKKQKDEKEKKHSAEKEATEKTKIELEEKNHKKIDEEK